MGKIGLKLFSINENYVQEAVKLFEHKIYDFIELYVVPESFDKCINLWKPLKIPFIIHAPHFKHGVNLANSDKFEENVKKAQEAQKFADELNAEFIIFHPGIVGDIKETVRQLNIINDSRILIENKPYFTVLNDGNICNGNSPEEIKFILENTKTGFCLDIGHCFCSANAKNIQQFKYLKEFLKLNPLMFHLVDNDFSSPIDKHLHFGQGNYEIEKILNYLPENPKITLETTKGSKENLNDFVKDIEYIKKFDYKITKATENDLLEVYNLSNDPTIRQNSFNSEEIKLNEHTKWFQKKLNSEDSIFFTVKNPDKFIGYIRFDRNTEVKNESIITIHLNQEFRGKSLGCKLIKISSEKIFSEYPIKKIIAFVKETNNSSLKSFEKAGYELISKDNINNNFWFKLIKEKV